MRKITSPSCVLFTLLIAVGLSAAAHPPGPSTKTKEWTTEDVIYTESASQFRISPDGRWVVWVKSVADKEKDARISNLFLSSLTEKKEIQLTRGKENHTQPRWSPSGQYIAFLSDRPRPDAKPEQAKTQLWLIHPFGGEPWPVTDFERGIRGYAWVDDNTIVFSAEEDPTLYEQEIKKKKDTTLVVEDHEHTPPVRLYRLAVKEKKVTRLTTNDDWIQLWAINRAGTRAVAVHQQSLAYQWDQKIPPKTFLHNLETGEAREILTEGRIRPVLFRWTKDGSGFYVVTPYSTHPEFLEATINILYFYDLARATAQQVDLDWENGLASGLEVTDDGFLALLAAGARFQMARYVRRGDTWQRTQVSGIHAGNIFDFALAEDGRNIVYEHSTASKPTQWYQATLRGAELNGALQLTELNKHLEGKTFARAEVIRWTGALGETVEGILRYPHNYEPGQRYPLILIIHGGPTGVDLDAWDDGYTTPHNLWNQRGAFVLQPNYHGSGNYGLRWAESICCGKYYELEVPDIEAGVDYLIERGLVDPDRVATMGWSNGSILSIALSVANPDRYKAVSAGAGDVEWFSDWANVDFGHAFDKYYFGASPLEDPQLYLRKSPFFQMDRVRAPTIIYFGTEDRNVPTDQGWSHYRALYHLGKAPVRFLLFPGEAHGLRKLTHQLRKLEEDLRWFDRYLFGTLAPPNEAFKKDSPLAMEFRRKNIQRFGTRYGVAFRPSGRRGQQVLIPEVVTRGELEIGRFEVTRAQFAAFDRNYIYEPGTENYPANGVTFEQAKAYVEWLSRLTGQTYTLPKVDEVESLYANRDGENTLDYWAGYSVNPDDAERLESKLAELGGRAPLLREVGSFRGQGSDTEELVFDLGGNVAEWAVAADGSGRLLGGSANRPADAKARPAAAASPADLAYVGFRVVRAR
ncbi:MAG: prolyl oligopeptidase family serine peptidase [Acidobacteriia bacterium]|jgi:dipeptidyl aminopeptidase/acylaminoacyl peptidase|nr:prolyl oligopeptidase family serine peptidase [Terriglobia bacterium]